MPTNSSYSYIRHYRRRAIASTWYMYTHTSVCMWLLVFIHLIYTSGTVMRFLTLGLYIIELVMWTLDYTYFKFFSSTLCVVIFTCSTGEWQHGMGVCVASYHSFVLYLSKRFDQHLHMCACVIARNRIIVHAGYIHCIYILPSKRFFPKLNQADNYHGHILRNVSDDHCFDWYVCA